MTNVLTKTWALFFGFGIICTGHGLQGTLIGVRAVFEGFSYLSTGFVVAGYYVAVSYTHLTLPTKRIV